MEMLQEVRGKDRKRTRNTVLQGEGEMCREAGEGKEREICRILEGKVGKVNRIRRRKRGERRGTR